MKIMNQVVEEAPFTILGVSFFMIGLSLKKS